MKNKKAQLDFEELNMVGIIGAILGAMVSIVVTNRMEGGLFIKIAGALVSAVVCYFVAGKIAGD